MSFTVLGLVLVLPVAVASAQSTVKYGIAFGLGMSNVAGDGWSTWSELAGADYNNRSMAGFAAGLFVRVPVGMRGVSLQPEVLYVTKGSNVDAPIITYPVLREPAEMVMRVRTDYVEIPLLVRYTLAEGKLATPHLIFGPMLAFKVSSKVKYKDYPAHIESLRTLLSEKDITNTKSLDYGLVLGGGVDIVIGKITSLTLDFRYTVGLIGVFEDGEFENIIHATAIPIFVDDRGKGLELKNRDLRIIVGLTF